MTQTHSNANDIPMSEQPGPEPITGTPIKVPVKRTAADRTPPSVPTNVKRTIAKPSTRSQASKMKISTINRDDLKLSLDEPVLLDFSYNAKTINPIFSREVLNQSNESSTKPLGFGQPQSGVPDWFLDYHRQQTHQNLLLTERLAMLEEVVAENKRLRTDLENANKRITDLESQLSSDYVPELSLDTIPTALPGSEVSKFAAPRVQNTSSNPNSFAAAASRGQSAPTPKPNKSVRRRKPTARQMEAIHRRFQPVTDTHDYKYLYFPSRYREPISSLRAKLHKLKINNARVLDVHYPDSQVVALLVHTDYESSVVAAFTPAKIEQLTNFDPLDPAHLRDPKLASLDVSVRKAKCIEIHQARLTRALKHIRESVRPAVGRAFYRKDWITLDQYKEAVPTPSTRTTTIITTNQANGDTTMDEVHDTFRVDPPSDTTATTNPLDVGESTPSQ